MVRIESLDPRKQLYFDHFTNLQNDFEQTINMGNALKNEIRHLNQSEIEITQMMQTRRDDLDRIEAYKEELKHTIDEMQKDTREIREALEVLKMTPMPQAGNYNKKTNEKLIEYADNMEKYFSMVREEQKSKRKRCDVM